MPIQYYNIIYTLVTVSLSILVIVDLIAYETELPVRNCAVTMHHTVDTW